MKIAAVMLLLSLHGQDPHREMDLTTLTSNIQLCRILMVVEVYPQLIQVQLQESS